ncbi:ImmA/IrrE family metallo-endopeptidase [Ralstonia pseudosolanacearum]|nr:ImmA/IrrE family metallo-endopeptidase [Ralstonia pseudosolanacearum]
MDEVSVQLRAREFVASVDVSQIADDLSVYVQAANAKLRKEELDEGESGFTITKPNGQHVITVNSLETEERQRFTICHEIAHIVLDLPSNHEEVPSGAYAKRDLSEVWCDTFAAELLMPYQAWKQRVPDGEPSIALIERMATEFRTSFPAAASRFATLADIPCAYVTMDAGVVRHAARSTSLRQARAWIPPRTPIPVGSVAHRLRAVGLSGIESAEVAQDLWFEDWDKGLELWELARHYHRTDTTVSLLWFSEEDLPEIGAGKFERSRVSNDGGLAELTGELPWPGKRKRK